MYQFIRIPHEVRTRNRATNKEVELEIKGEDVKMDKMILEGLKDPIIHILRNAVDHAIDCHNRSEKHFHQIQTMAG